MACTICGTIARNGRPTREPRCMPAPLIRVTHCLWCAMQTRVVSVVNRQGLHARACARIVVAVMLLTASVGATVRIEVDGPDEAQAMKEIAALFHDGFGERS